MGKRELLLVVVFVVLGVGIYQVTAPASEPDRPGFSLSRLVQFAKAHFHGARERRTITRTASVSPTAKTTTVELPDLRGNVIIEGSDRDDIEVTLEAGLAGIDKADLDGQEKALGLRAADSGATATVRVSFDHPGRTPGYDMRVAVPRGLVVQLSGRGTAEVSGVAGLRFAGYRGQVTTQDIAGEISGTLDHARAEFGPGATIKVQMENGRLRAEAPKDVTVDGEHGTVEIVDPAGPVTLKTDYLRMDVRGTGGPVSVTGEGGTITLRDVAHPLTIDAERLTVSAELARPVATTIAVEDDTVEVTLPREGGVQLEAAIEDGTLRVPEGFEATRTERKESVSATVAGGGPLVKVTVNRGELRIRARVTPGT